MSVNVQLLLITLYMALCPRILFAMPSTLIWADEFNYSGLPDPDKWTYEEGFVRNGERQFYQVNNAKNARVEGGYLIIEAHFSAPKDTGGFFNSLFSPRLKGSFTSASLTTEHLHGWRYGRIDVRAKLPQGRGIWPAIWLLGSNIKTVGWPACGEIDIMEFVGFKKNVVHSAIHSTRRNHYKKNSVGSSYILNDLGDAFHVYSVARSAERIDFYIDDFLYFSYQKEGVSNALWPFDKPMYLILNMAVGGGWGGQKGIDTAIFPQQFIIDYVRVYE